MDLPNPDRIFKLLSIMGKSTVISLAQKQFIPHIREVFTDHNEEELRKMILASYPLVRNDAPENLQKMMANIGSNDEIHEQWKGVVMSTITPDNILMWLKDPEEWLPDDASFKQVENIRRCGRVIEGTAGGREWLEEQVLDIYRIAQIVPEDRTPAKADD